MTDRPAPGYTPARGEAKFPDLTLHKRGINRFSVPWGLSNLTWIVNTMERWGFEVNIYNVPDLESFLQAVLQQPCSVTSDFNFPKWHY